MNGASPDDQGRGIRPPEDLESIVGISAAVRGDELRVDRAPTISVRRGRVTTRREGIPVGLKEGEIYRDFAIDVEIEGA